MPGSTLWIGLGMSIGILLSWDEALMAIDPGKETVAAIAAQAERSLADQRELQQQRTRTPVRANTVSRPRTAWEIAIGPGYVRAGSPVLSTPSRTAVSSTFHELKLLRHQLTAWTPQLDGNKRQTIDEVVSLSPISALDRFCVITGQ